MRRGRGNSSLASLPTDFSGAPRRANIKFIFSQTAITTILCLQCVSLSHSPPSWFFHFFSYSLFLFFVVNWNVIRQQFNAFFHPPDHIWKIIGFNHHSFIPLSNYFSMANSRYSYLFSHFFFVYNLREFFCYLLHFSSSHFVLPHLYSPFRLHWIYPLFQNSLCSFFPLQLVLHAWHHPNMMGHRLIFFVFLSFSNFPLKSSMSWFIRPRN